ncbi:MAG: zinc-ribbon domain-containing protein, partial [Desulfatibacillaceae bacterium]|nr:zinc-ribbon domain-containing protein [Desulfatibacillaceae bacterium]
MIVNCPKCATKLSLDDSLVKGKKVKVRCAVCQDIFSAGPLPDASLGLGADLDLDLNLDLSELGDLEAGLEDALSEAPEERLSPLADSGDLDLNLPNLDDLEDGLASAMSSPGGESQPAAPQAARPPEPPLIDDEDTLGELGDLSDDDLALSADEEPSAKPADDMGELPDLAAEIEDGLGGDSPSQDLLADKDEDTLGDLGDLADEDLALAADEGPAAKPVDDMGELPDLAAEIEDGLGGDSPSQDLLA